VLSRGRRKRVTQVVAQIVLVTVVLGLVAGGFAGILFVTAQLTANPDLLTGSALDNPAFDKIVSYAQRCHMHSAQSPLQLESGSLPALHRMRCSANF